MMAPQDYDVHLPVRVLALQNSELWLRPTDLSWHFPILMTFREESLKNYRSENKAEEFKKQKMQKNDDGQSYARHRPGHGTNQ